MICYILQYGRMMHYKEHFSALLLMNKRAKTAQWELWHIYSFFARCYLTEYDYCCRL